MNANRTPRPDPREPEPDASTPRPGAASALLRWQLGLAHRLLDSAIERCPSELIHRHPPGLSAPAGACYAHAILSEDLIVNGVLAGGRPLAFTTWAGRTGLSDLPDLPVSWSTGLAIPVSRPLAEHASWRAWSRRVQVDLPRFRQYAQAVYAATDAYLVTLPDAALEPARRELPGCLLNALLLTIATRRGEIAALLAVIEQPPGDARPATTSSDPNTVAPSDPNTVASSDAEAVAPSDPSPDCCHGPLPDR
jgi:hypothetical protein